KKRFPRIIYPFLFWIILSILVLTLTQQDLSIFNSAYHYFSFAIEIFLTKRWYVWMLIGVYLIMPIINEFIKNKGLKGVEYFLILWFITTVICCITQYMKVSMYFLDLTFFAGPLGYVMLGYYLHNKKFKYSPNKMVLSGLILFALGTIFKVLMLWNGIHVCVYYIFQTSSYLEIDIFNIIQIMGMFLTIKYLNNVTIKGKAKLSHFLSTGIPRKLTDSLSRSSYGIYLNHYIVIDIILALNLKLTKHNALKWIPPLIIIVLITSWLIVLIVKKIPYLQKISGYY
ncbi:MAG: acyltransferase family protein, partial [Methanobrevibacter sp.]|nr:acyltransferase family protein [Methanobrevibacter sp.]